MSMNSSNSPASVLPLGSGRDIHTGEWFRVYAVTDLDGNTSPVCVSFSAVAKSENAPLNAIAVAGYPVPTQRSERAHLLKRLGQLPDKRLRLTSSTGWAENSFFTPRSKYPSDSDIIGNFGSLTAHHRFAMLGTPEPWLKKVAALAFGNSLAMCMLMVAFCGPAMRLLNLKSAGVILVGGSSIGKSTILVVAGSVWGGGGPMGFGDTWLTTPNAVDVRAQAHTDVFDTYDEPKLAGVTPKEVAANVLHTIFRLEGGQTKARLNDGGARPVWRLPFLGSSEATLPELARTAGQPITTGAYVRATDIRADAGGGM